MEIKICKTCEGTGEIRQDVGTHSCEWELNTCNRCNGTGRIKTRSYSFSVSFSMNDKEIHKTDSEIINLIRNLESKQ